MNHAHHPKISIVNGTHIISDKFSLNLQNGRLETYKRVSRRKQKALYNKAMRYWKRANEV